MLCGFQVVVVRDHVRRAKLELWVAGEGNDVDLLGEEVAEMPCLFTSLPGQVRRAAKEFELESGADPGPG